MDLDLVEKEMKQQAADAAELVKLHASLSNAKTLLRQAADREKITKERDKLKGQIAAGADLSMVESLKLRYFF